MVDNIQAGIEDFRNAGFGSLMHFRISRILMICSKYDQFIMEEDGRIESQVYREYVGLNMSNSPKFIWVESAAEARKVMAVDPEIDMIICMFNEIDKEIFPFASEIKSSGSEVPFVLLMHYSREIRKKVTSQAHSAVDFVFSWHGNADLILAIIKLFEDRKNAENDILTVGVQSILLVEDSIRYYSTYLPELYKLILTQSSEFLKETLNEDQRKNRKRSRPKILLATCYDDAEELYMRYRGHFLGVISDVGMVRRRGDAPSTEKLDAGIDLVEMIRKDEPLMPILLQSSQESVGETAKALGVGFLKKYSRTLFLQLSDYLKEEFGFGDFVFKDATGAECGRAANLQELEAVIKHVPDNVLVSNTSRNMFSKWFFARGLFTLANIFRSEHHDKAEEARAFLVQQVKTYQKAMGRGIIASFSGESYDRYITFARIGDGSLGGKARGLAFLNKIIDEYAISAKYESLSVSIPRTVVITTEYFDEFILENGLQYVIDSELSDDEILSEFVASRLPERLLDELKVYIGTVHSPLAIRSSSKLEDSNYQPFAGVYSTYMIPNTENKDQMLRMLGKAIKSVYASVYYNGSRNYIQTTGNLQSEEKMAVILQEICGSEHDGLYYPFCSGVGRSVNFYPIGNEHTEDGIVNMVFGLGKAVVDGGRTLRFNPKYPKKILQLSQPELAVRDCQKQMYALDLRPGAFKISKNDSINFVKMPVADAMASFRAKDDVFSTYDLDNNRIVPGTEARGAKLVTFDPVLKYGKFPIARALSDIMALCKKELLNDVEIEFAADMRGDKMSLRLLQVRPISLHSDGADTRIVDVESGMNPILLRSGKALGSGLISGMKYILMVSPDKFDTLHTIEAAKEISAINAALRNAGESYILVGPGRWGSADKNLGIPVAWNDISEAKLIVEYSMPGFQVEPSQGTHFFQNITSLGVGYLSIDQVNGGGEVDFGAIGQLDLVQAHEYVSLYRCASGLVACIDRDTDKAVAGICIE